MKQVILDGKPITPSKIICIGRNYVAHIEELNNQIPDQMVVFYKPNTAISDTLFSYHQEPLSYEGELCLMYQQGKFSAVAFGLDLTKRGLQSILKSKQLPWERCKSFSKSAVFSPFVSVSEISNKLSFDLYIDDKLTQIGNLELMMFPPEQILADLQSFIELEDGDIVMTGTPKGVGEIQKGSQYRGTIKWEGTPITEGCWIAE